MKQSFFTLDFGTATDLGTRYSVNQDYHKSDQEQGIFIVADGVGGGPAGEVASRVAVNAAYGYLRRSIAHAPEQHLKNQVEGSIQKAQQTLLEMIAQAPIYQGMGTTLMIAWFPGDRRRLWLAHVGDCRCYRLRQENLELLTHDHTVLNVVRDSGQLPEDPDDWPPRHRLSQALGSKYNLAPQVLSKPVQPEDLFLLCSDGVYDPVGEEPLIQILSQPAHPQDICEALIQAVNAAEGKDNSTALVVKVIEQNRRNIKKEQSQVKVNTIG